ncbi:hypothetical protein KEH57_09430 [Burkholderia cenocepacia]|uniref:hypothetical protein n=1 Tax=Burkholderia cenocepacia TaxID=95486 RepID=UPI001BA6A955|nr:hypothetical protein [Burkholderia cenocepacia]QUO23816.1 hypothetical protein KEH57_09430 [Burkholderia cenocepacia]
MQELSNGLGDLKKLTFERSKAMPPDRSAAPPAWRRKLAHVIVAVGLTWAALHVILQAILSTAPVHR